MTTIHHPGPPATPAGTLTTVSGGTAQPLPMVGYVAPEPGAEFAPDVSGSPIRVFHRHPAPPSSDHRTPRMVDLDEYMAIQPAALERAFFGLFDLEDRKAYEMDGSVAILSIDGPLMQRGGWWYDGYQSIRGRFEKALADKAVSAVVLKINSPGGVCAGCFSAARGMRALKDDAGKPVFAYADESAYSAAYAMACIADEIYLPPEGGVGSVGVIGVLEDWTAFNERVGIKVAVITSGEFKSDGHPDVPLSKAVVDRYQARINQLAQAFAELVGGARAMAPSAVLKLEAACLYGEEAVKAGLANGIATLEETVAKAQAKGLSSKTSARSTLGSVGAVKGTAMTFPNKAGSAEQNSVEVMAGELVVSHADFALAAGLAHDASKGDVLAKMAKDRSEADAARAGAAKLLAEVGATSTDEAIGKLSAERDTMTALVKAITGDENATAQDALAQLAAERKANESAQARALIEEAAAAGKTAGEKAFELFEKHGMAALKAHLDALVPHAALVATAPTQKQEPGAAKSKADPSGEGEVVLSEDDKRFCERYGISEKDFLAARKDEIEAERANKRKRDS